MKKFLVLIIFIMMPELDASSQSASQADTKSGAESKRNGKENITFEINKLKRTVTPIDKQTGKRRGNPIKFNRPTNFVITPDHDMAYVLEARGAIVPINLDTLKAEDPILIQNFVADPMNPPDLIATDGITAYIANTQTYEIIPINLTTGDNLGSIYVSRLPQSIKITGDTAYVIHSGGQASPIDIETNTLGQLIVPESEAAPKAPPAPTFTIPATTNPEEENRPAGAGSDVPASAGSSTLSSSGK